MLETLISLAGGGVLRLLPEIIGFFSKKEDNSHELKMLDKQLEMERLQTSDKLLVNAQKFDADKVLAILDAQKSALTDQMKLTGIKIVDALNALVRPLTTYYFLIMFGTYKAALLGVALREQSVFNAIISVYSEADQIMLAGILSFWFVGRVFDKQK